MSNWFVWAWPANTMLALILTPPRQSCLSSLQPLSEIQEAVDLLSGLERQLVSSRAGHRSSSSSPLDEVIEARVRALIRTWSERWGSPSSSSAASSDAFAVSEGFLSGGFGGGPQILVVLNLRLMLLGMVSQVVVGGEGDSWAAGRLSPRSSSSSIQVMCEV